MNEADNSHGFTDQQLRLFGIFFPHATKRTFDALKSGQRFVYYTSAALPCRSSAAMKCGCESRP
jgi:hypothetical protein